MLIPGLEDGSDIPFAPTCTRARLILAFIRESLIALYRSENSNSSRRHSGEPAEAASWTTSRRKAV